jgi:hypothetical protein
MAENLQATFTEVLEIKVDTSKFQRGLQELKALYQKWVRELGDDAPNVLGAGAFKGLQEQVSAVMNAMDETAQSMRELSKAVEDSFGRQDRASEESTRRQIDATARKQKAAIGALSEEEQRIENNRKLLEKYKESITEAERAFRNLETEQSGEASRGGATEEKAALARRDILNQEMKVAQELADLEERRNRSQKKFDDEREQYLADFQRTREKSEGDAAARGRKVFEQDMEMAEGLFQIEERRRKAQQDFEIEREGVVNRAADNLSKTLTQYENAAKATGRINEELQLAQTKASGDREAYQRELEGIVARVKQQREQLASDIRTNRPTSEEGASPEQIARVKEYNDLTKQQRTLVRELSSVRRQANQDAQAEQERVNRSLEETRQRLERLSRLELKGNVNEYLKRLQSDFDAVDQKIKEFENRFRVNPNRGSGTAAPDVNQQAEYNKLLKEQEALINEAGRATRKLRSETNLHAKQNQSFLGRAVEDIRLYTASMTKMILVIQGIILLEQALFAALSAPFKAAKNGLDVLREMEERQHSLTTTIFANVELSQDMSENFRLSQQAATETLAILRQRAAATGLGLEDLQNTFKALTESGAVGLVKDLREVITLTEKFQVLLTNMGSGPLATQISLEEVAKLFRGELSEGGNKFLTMLGISNRRWEQITANAKTHRDLIAQLTPYMQKYDQAVKAGEGTQQKLINQITLLFDIITSDATNNLFSRLTAALQYLNEWLQKNSPVLSRWFALFVDGLSSIAEGWGRLLRAFPLLEEALKLVAIAGVGVTHVLKDILALAEFSVKNFESMKKNGSFLPSKEDFEKARKEYQKFSSDLDRDTRAATDFIINGVGRAPFGPTREQLGAGPLDITDPKVKPPGFDNRSHLSELSKQFATEKQLITNELNAIKEKYDDLQQDINRTLSDRVISQRDASAQIVKANAQELSEIEVLRQRALKTVADQRGKVRNDPALEKDRKQALETLAKEELSINEQFERERRRIEKENLNAERLASRELRSVLEERFKGRLELLQQTAQAELTELQELRQQGFLTEVQYFDATLVAAETNHNARQRLLKLRLDSEAAGSDEYERLVNEYRQTEQEYTEQVRLNTRIREQLLLEEQNRRTEFFQQQRSLVLEQRALEASITDVISQPVGVSSSQTALLDLKSRELDQLEREKLLQLQVAAAKNAESEETRRLVLELKGLENQRLSLFQQRLGQVEAGVANPAVRNIERDRVIQEERQRRQERVAGASENLRQFDRVFGQSDDPVFQQAREQFTEALEQAGKELLEFNQVVESAAPSVKSSFTRVLDLLIGPGVREAFSKAEDGVTRFAIGANAAVDALANIGALVDTFKQGRAQGGILGGVGAVTGQLSGALSFIPGVGQFLPAISGVLSFVGSLFANAAKKIAEDVKRSFEKTIDQYRSGNATLVTTIQQLERQRSEAIARLSGKKGGKDQLKEILPEFDREIAELRQTQQQIVTDFDSALQSLRIQSDTLSQVDRQWRSINQQVKDYLGAGGDAAKAAEFLRLSLADLQADLARELEQSERDAIQEVLRLNDLLKQRQSLLDDFKQREFDLINADSIERRQAGSVTRGKELDRLREEHTEQLRQLDDQIRLTDQRVQKEREIFNLSTDIAAVRRRDEELALNALDGYIQKLQDLKALVGMSVSFAPAGVGSVIQIGSVDVVIQGTGTQAGQQAANAFLDEVYRKARLIP